MDKSLRENAEKWFKFADNDLQAAKKLAGEFNNIACFHCQQSAEKYLKGLLILLEKEFRKSHDLNYLLDLLECSAPEEIMSAAELLTEYSVESRYPGDFSAINDQETQDVIKEAELIKAFVLNKIPE
jgi:HEPN domain-containing protein